jgi:mannose-1-phosphate guanylyltransferase/mannose-1-phosphate guanylyltransferase/mannose-6-phosphate isomerase
VDFNDQRSCVAFEEGGLNGAVGSFGHTASRGGHSAPVIVPVILSGGAGTRLWPFSTEDSPKQFLPLTGDESLFKQALARVSDRSRFRAPIVVGSARHAQLCETAIAHEGADARVILEPTARNTAAAIAMAASVAEQMYGGDVLLLVMPSDHVIEDLEAFHQAIATGTEAARRGRLVTFGIRPTSADTGYGYLHMGSELAEAPGVKEVARFVEKPGLDVAQMMVAAGDYLWNAGIFMFTAQSLLTEVKSHAPEIGEAAQNAVRAAHREGIRVMPDASALMKCPSESIDYAVMERSAQVAVVPMSPGWSDLGSWDALADLMEGAPSEGPVVALDCDRSYIRSDRLQIAALGVQDLIVVASGDRLLILPRGRSQEVKKLLAAMDAKAEVAAPIGEPVLTLDSIAA